MVTSFQHEIFVPQSATSTSFGTADGWPPSRADEAGMGTGRRPFLNGGLMKVSRTTRSGSCAALNDECERMSQFPYTDPKWVGYVFNNAKQFQKGSNEPDATRVSADFDHSRGANPKF